MIDYIDIWRRQRNSKKAKHKAQTQKVKKKLTYSEAESLHIEAFENIDCLECANCCKSFRHYFES